MKEDTAQVRVSMPIGDLWKAMSSDITQMAPKVLRDFIAEVELLEGDGGHGSVLLFKFGPAVPKLIYQKEKIVELDESLHKIALEVLEGGHLDNGYSSYTTSFKLSAVEKAETFIDVKVLYETKPDHTHIPGGTIKGPIHYIKCLEKVLKID
ncbi:hypothetical protein OSB04_un001270 [Centaurea solstitialis]|uniref:Bet v I/Major latex protein domain-containing protein n=1 Tax=Centaurea solstitialis TaxID=347529 RepID=A0AA38VUS4_9ASTR|nr:hypothetical protein OSB04_un001270 [Centaurea solstitialis]